MERDKVCGGPFETLAHKPLSSQTDVVDFRYDFVDTKSTCYPGL